MTNNLHSHIKLASKSNSITQNYQSGLIERQSEPLSVDKPKSTDKVGNKESKNWYDVGSINVGSKGAESSLSKNSKKINNKRGRDVSKTLSKYKHDNKKLTHDILKVYSKDAKSKGSQKEVQSDLAK